VDVTGIASAIHPLAEQIKILGRGIGSPRPTPFYWIFLRMTAFGERIAQKSTVRQSLAYSPFVRQHKDKKYLDIMTI
jgi:hypothetical protein